MRSKQRVVFDEWPVLDDFSGEPRDKDALPNALPAKVSRRGGKKDDEEADDDGFIDRLARVAIEIRISASGRVCGECKHIRKGWCAEKRNVDGNALAVLYPTAVACGQYVAKET